MLDRNKLNQFYNDLRFLLRQPVKVILICLSDGQTKNVTEINNEVHKYNSAINSPVFLTQLKDMGYLTMYKKGKFHYYTIVGDKIKSLKDTLEKFHLAYKKIKAL